MEFLNENNLEDLIVSDNKGMKYLNTDMVECDYFKFLAGDLAAKRNFTYTYMTEYWWGEETLGKLTEMKYDM